MKAITDDYLNGIDKGEVNRITKMLKYNKHAYLDISLRHPYGHGVVY